MVKVGITTPESLGQKRPYVIVGAFVAGMLLTPPDIFSQTMLAIPVWILFEAGLYFSRGVKPKVEDEDADPEGAGPGDTVPTPNSGARRAEEHEP